jgi:hypothetical protein
MAFAALVELLPTCAGLAVASRHGRRCARGRSGRPRSKVCAQQVSGWPRRVISPRHRAACVRRLVDGAGGVRPPDANPAAGWLLADDDLVLWHDLHGAVLATIRTRQRTSWPSGRVTRIRSPVSARLRQSSGGACVGLERADHSIADDDPLRDFPGQPRHAVDDTADESDTYARAMHLKRDRPAGGQAAGSGDRGETSARRYVLRRRATS